LAHFLNPEKECKYFFFLTKPGRGSGSKKPISKNAYLCRPSAVGWLVWQMVLLGTARQQSPIAGKLVLWAGLFFFLFFWSAIHVLVGL
jgi:hypothetical protein